MKDYPKQNQTALFLDGMQENVSRGASGRRGGELLSAPATAMPCLQVVPGPWIRPSYVTQFASA